MMKKFFKTVAKNYNNYLFILALIFLFASCDQEGEFFDRDYMRLNFSIVYPEFTNPNDYTVTFNGKDITKTFFSRDELTGRLQVFAKDAEIPELDIEVMVVPNQNILLIKLPGKNIELYREEDFMKFSATMSLFEGYKAVFNDQEILDGENYLKKENIPGDLVFYGEEGTTPVYTIEDVTVEAGQNIVILQASETEFVWLEGGNNNEEPPATKNLCKVNFFYTPTGPLNVDSIRLELYTSDAYFASGNLFPVDTIVLEKGKLSPYVVLDNAQFWESYGSWAIFTYGLYNAETGEEIYNVWNASFMFSIEDYNGDYSNSRYKFATYQVAYTVSPWDGSYIYSNKFIMGEPW